jgi:hypothetical protein
MRARHSYEIRVTRGGRGPAFLAGTDRRDRIEVVDLQSGEAIYVWDLAPRAAARVLRALRDDLLTMDEDEFVAAWREAGS